METGKCWVIAVILGATAVMVGCKGNSEGANEGPDGYQLGCNVRNDGSAGVLVLDVTVKGLPANLEVLLYDPKGELDGSASLTADEMRMTNSQRVTIVTFRGDGSKEGIHTVSVRRKDRATILVSKKVSLKRNGFQWFQGQIPMARS